MLTPMDIHDKQFKKGFRGYSPDAVDEFLDEVVNDYEKLCKDNAQLKEELSSKRKELEQYHTLEKNLHDTVALAQKTAEDIISHAKKCAADEKYNAKQECDNMKMQAELEIKRKVEMGEARGRTVQAEYERLIAEKQHFANSIRVLLEAELAILDKNTPLPNRKFNGGTSNKAPLNAKTEVAANETKVMEKPLTDKKAEENRINANGEKEVIVAFAQKSDENTKTIATKDDDMDKTMAYTPIGRKREGNN